MDEEVTVLSSTMLDEDLSNLHVTSPGSHDEKSCDDNGSGSPDNTNLKLEGNAPYENNADCDENANYGGNAVSNESINSVGHIDHPPSLESTWRNEPEDIVIEYNLDLNLYSELPTTTSIRLLNILPGESTSIIQTTLHVVDLEDDPAYEALSYVWGTKQNPTQIICNGQYFHVTPNLGAALRRLRSNETPRTVWIDAICINQNDVDERSMQVGQMGDIYSKANRVLIWLGEGNAECLPWALPLLQRIAEGVHEEAKKRTADFDPEWDEVSYEDAKNFEHPDLPVVDDPRWNAVMSVLDSEWCSRVWVLQEVAKAKVVIVIIGAFDLHWFHIVGCASWMRIMSLECLVQQMVLLPDESFATSAESSILDVIQRDQDTTARIHHIAMARLKLGVEGTSLITMLIPGDLSASFHATDPRDKVYALLGISEEGSQLDQHPLLQIDYRKDVTTVYGDVVRHYLSQPWTALYPNHEKGGLDVLRTRGLPLTDVEVPDYLEKAWKLPSWLPRWDTDDIELFASVSDSWCAASLNTAITVRDADSPDCLTLKGFRLTSIIKTIDTDLVDGNHITQIYDLMKDALPNYSSSKNFKEHFVQAITGGASKMKPVQSILDELREGIRPETFNEEDLDAYFNNDPESEESRLLKRSLNHYGKIFITGDGRMGFGQIMLAHGDVVCLLFGGRYPYLLRPFGEQFRLIGECYIPGIMQGQVMELWKSGYLHGIDEEWFELR